MKHWQKPEAWRAAQMFNNLLTLSGKTENLIEWKYCFDVRQGFWYHQRGMET